MNKLTKLQWNRAEQFLRQLLGSTIIEIIDIAPSDDNPDLILYYFEVPNAPYCGQQGIEKSTSDEVLNG